MKREWNVERTCYVAADNGVEQGKNLLIALDTQYISSSYVQKKKSTFVKCHMY